MPITRYKRRRHLKSSKKTKRCNKRSYFRRRHRHIYRGGLPGPDGIELFDGMLTDNVPTIDRSNECNTPTPSGLTQCQLTSKINLPENQQTYLTAYNNFINAANAYRIGLINNLPTILQLQSNYDNAQAEFKKVFGKNVSAYGKSLTQDQIKHVLAAQRLYNCARPDFVSYSDENRELCDGSPPLPNLSNALPFTPYVASQNTLSNLVSTSNGFQRRTL